ncbi:MAG: TRAP transporter large permease [Clostridiales Family XIII bacterium]|jgi:tripartite ATP-independent transporter DctM subunit|nr:TRAP transporter large permease [Clostridiales Family XIII bacterium]
MNPIALAIVAIAVFLVLIFLGMNIGLALTLVGTVGYALAVTPGAALGLLRSLPASQAGSYALMVIPMFIIMGNFAFEAGLSKGLYEACNKWLSRLPGNLACGTIAACAGFGAICGSSAATAATMGTIAVPAMRQYGYADQLATGSVAMGGTLGVMIPPSTIFVVYAVVAEESVGQLFAAGIIPGLILTVLCIFTVVLLVTANKKLAPPPQKTPWMERFLSLSGLIPVVILFSVVLGGMFSGWFTVNQASAIGAAVACAITVFRGKFTWATFKKVMATSVQTSAMTFLIMVGAAVFVTFLNITGFPKMLAASIAALTVSKYVIILLMTLIYLLIGMIMDELPAIIMTVPIFLPIIESLGYDPIWFGVYIVLNCELGAISPPVGLTCFILSGIAKDVPLGTIFRGAIPFAATVFLMIALISVFPQIATFLPGLLFSR